MSHRTYIPPDRARSVKRRRAARRRICAAKRRYHSKQEAREAMYAVSQGDPDSVGLMVYRCKVCDYWHFGHKTTRYRPVFDSDEQEQEQ